MEVIVEQLILQLVNILGFGGFVVWLNYHQTTSTIPKMEEKHQQNLDLQLSQFRDEMAATRTQFREELAETRAHYERVIEKILTDHEKAVAAMVESCGRRPADAVR
jgi:hypothetical protein